MNTTPLLILCASVLGSFIAAPAYAQPIQKQYGQVAEIEIDRAQLEEYKVAVKEHIEIATRVEPGLRRVRKRQSDPCPRVRNLPRYGRLQIASANRAFQEIQGDHGEDGQITQASADNTHHAWLEVMQARVRFVADISERRRQTKLTIAPTGRAVHRLCSLECEC